MPDNLENPVNPENPVDAVEVGQTVRLSIDRMAHGGEGIATGPDGRVVFVRGAYPGDVVSAQITEVKKKFARAELTEVLTAGAYRGPQRCPAAAQGAGCCDFGDLDPRREPELKATILAGQLGRVVDLAGLPDTEVIALSPTRGWRTRVRLGVDEKGRAGARKLGSNDLVTSVACTQVAEGLLDGIVGENARRFTPGAEVVVVRDSAGGRHVVETRKAPRGSRVENVAEHLEGEKFVAEQADGVEFAFPPTAFWQAHSAAPNAYTGLIRRWLADAPLSEAHTPVAWDLYGGVGLFVPALSDSLGAGAKVISVDYSPAANTPQAGLASYDVDRVNKRVEQAVDQLSGPHVVALDPPRTGAGAKVIAATAKANPARVIHIGCDPATFSRDIASWKEHGYRIERLALLDAFPGTHHFEVVAQLGH